MDAAYKDYPFLFSSKGIIARKVDDTANPSEFLNLDNLEELFENAFSQRLGTTILNATGTVPNTLTGTVHSLGKLSGLNGSAWRYAATTAGRLYRRSGLTAGPYSQISNTTSGNPMWMVSFRPDISSMPWMFFADADGMLKDNGTLAAAQQMGIFQPQYPVVAAVQSPDLITLDNYTGAAGSYTYTGISGGTIGNYVNTTLTSAILVSGIQDVTVADPTQIQQFQLLTIGGSQTVLVLMVTSTGFLANVAPAANGSTVTAASLSVSVPASTTATIAKAFVGKPISGWPVALSQSDYIGIQVYVSDPSQIQSITIKFDCGNGTFNSDYFYKVLAQGPMQSMLESVNDPTTAATDALLSNSLGLFNNSSSGIGQLSTGLNVWTPFLFQLSDFAGSGRADFEDPVFNWQNVNGYQIQIVTNQQTSVVVQIGALILEGGSGPDTLGGVAYDYRFTFYNANDGSESNGSMEMTNVNPPNQTNWVYPRRQPIKLTLKWVNPADAQITHLRPYRRGGTLGDNWRRLDQVPITGLGQMFYTDKTSDADLSAADILSLTNDVPVTSVLPTPVNTTLNGAITGGLISDQPVTVLTTANMSVGQLVTIGTPTDVANDFETVIVLKVLSGTQFQALVQNNHASGESVQATARVGQPVTMMALAYGTMYFAGDSNNPHFLYYSAGNNPQAVGEANFIEVGSPDDPITAIVNLKGNLYVSTRKYWWAIAPNTNSKATPYPTAAKHGCVAPQGYCVTEKGVFYQAIDGIRFFAGGASEYLTQDLEFIFQGIGTTPIEEADPTQFANTRMAYWNNMIFVSYVGLDGLRHRLVYHTIYNRWRNDDLDAQSLLLEEDTNQLLFGDTAGYVHLDRQPAPTDQAVAGGVVQAAAIPIDLLTPYNNQGSPDIQKNYNELTMDVNTQGQTLTATLLFDDGEFSINLGTFSNTQRGKINFSLNSGDGYTFYKVALQLTGNLSQFVYIYQCSIKAIPVAKTRRTFDTYKLNLGTEDSKFAKNSWWDYNSTQPVNVTVTYDDGFQFPFTLPATAGVRNVLRQRLPGNRSFRLIRFVGTSPADFQLWSCKCEMKPLAFGKGYTVSEFTPN